MSDNESKFSAVLKNRQVNAPPPTKRQESKKSQPEPQEPQRQRGRPPGKGKRLNPAFSQVTAYIPAHLHTKTKINLLRLPEKKEFSELVAELLVAWNEEQD